MANDEVHKLISQLAERYSEKRNCHLTVARSCIATTINIALLCGSARMILERYRAISMASFNSHVQESSQPTVLDIADDESSLPDLDTVLVYPSTVDSEFSFVQHYAPQIHPVIGN
jgi:hypothetical protein